MIQVKGKGNKPRVVMIKQHIIQNELNEWLELKNCNNSLLFCNQKGNELTQSYISRTVEDILTYAGIRKEKNGAHMLRHSFATLLYSKHRDLILAQETKMDGMLNKIQNLLNTSKTEKIDTSVFDKQDEEKEDTEVTVQPDSILDIRLDTDPIKTEEPVEEEKKEEEPSSSGNSNKIDLGRMESLLNGLNK
jgi:hypothetical protein